MITALKSIALSAIFSAVAVLLHSWNEPFGLFLALLIVVGMMRAVRDLAAPSARGKLAKKIPSILAAGTWVVIAWVASTARNGDEILIEGDTIGSSFVIGASAFVALAVIAKSK